MRLAEANQSVGERYRLQKNPPRSAERDRGGWFNQVVSSYCGVKFW
jgi:hypothetical protein